VAEKRKLLRKGVLKRGRMRLKAFSVVGTKAQPETTTETGVKRGASMPNLTAIDEARRY